jgi:hypothetical protein
MNRFVSNVKSKFSKELRESKENQQNKFLIKLDEFPDLSGNVKYIQPLKTDYLDIASKEKITQNQNENQNKYILPVGWVSITGYNFNQIKREYNLKKESSLNTIYSDIEKMINRWEKYKESYIDLYGEYNYEYNYLMPNFEYLIDDENDLEENIEDTDIENYENYENYDNYDYFS